VLGEVVGQAPVEGRLQGQWEERTLEILGPAHESFIVERECGGAEDVESVEHCE